MSNIKSQCLVMGSYGIVVFLFYLFSSSIIETIFFCKAKEAYINQ